MRSESDETTMPVQDVLELLGPSTRYHKMHFLFTQYAAILAGMHTFVMMFITLDPVPTCRQEFYPCDGRPVMPLHEYCAEPAFVQKQYELMPGGMNLRSGTAAAMKQTSLALEFGLYCDNNWLLPMVGSGYFLGSLMGTIIFGGVADRWGRKPAFTAACICLAVTSWVGMFATHFATFLVIRVLHGMSCGGFFVVTFVYLTEMFPKSHYSIVGVMDQAAFALGYLAIAPIAYVFPTWRELCFVPSLFCLPMLPWCFFSAEESPSWYSSQNYIDRAHQTLKRIAASVDPQLMSTIRVVPQWLAQTQKKQSCLRLLGDLCGTQILCVFLLGMCLMWMTVACSYYGVATSAEYIGGSVYANTMWLALLEFPAQALVIYTAKKAGNHGACYILLFATSCSCVLYLYPSPIVGKAAVFSAQLFVCAAMSVVYLYTAEVYPTQARSAMMGITSASGRFGSMIAMQLRHFGNANPTIPMMCWGLAAAIGGGIFRYLPPTDGIVPPETIEEFAARARNSFGVGDDLHNSGDEAPLVAIPGGATLTVDGASSSTTMTKRPLEAVI